MDSLLSIVQMPAGVPVGTLAIGKAGAVNAALLAAAILALGDEALAGGSTTGASAQTTRSPNARMSLDPGSTIGIVGGGQLGRMLAIAAASSATSATSSIRTSGPAPPRSPPVTRAPPSTIWARWTLRRAVDVVTYEFENLPVEPLAVLGDKLRPGHKSLAVAQDRADEKQFIERAGARVAPWRAVASLDDVHEAPRRARRSDRAQDPALRL